MKHSKKQFAWKVVYVKDKKLLSAVWHNPVQYKINRWVYPEKDAFLPWLFVFRTRWQARSFKRNMTGRWYNARNLSVFKCEVKNASAHARKTKNNELLYPVAFRNGTLFVDAVKLIK